MGLLNAYNGQEREPEESRNNNLDEDIMDRPKRGVVR